MRDARGGRRRAVIQHSPGARTPFHIYARGAPGAPHGTFSVKLWRVSPDTRRHRGAHPSDAELFAPGQLARLRAATGDLSWLLARGYQTRSALKLVGDRHALDERQRLAVSRAACSDAQREARGARLVPPDALRGAGLVVDGFNLLITVEAALGGGVVLLCRDGCARDLSSVHGSYRSVRETEPAIALAGEALARLRPAHARWLLDRPVSNSGRLAAKIREVALVRGWDWEVETAFNPDAEIARSGRVAVTSDSTILDAAPAWANLAAHLVARLPGVWVVDLRDEG